MIELKALLVEIRQLEDKLEEEWLDDPIIDLDTLDRIADIRRDLYLCIKWREADLTELKQQARDVLKEHKENNGQHISHTKETKGRQGR